MTNFVWVSKDVVLAVHDEQLAEHGGLGGVRDMGMLDSALARPQSMASYNNCDNPAKLAAAYIDGISKNHPFVDGNKRVAFVVSALFLRLNGYKLTATDIDCVLTMLSVASGEISEDALTEWFQKNIKSV